MSKKTETFVEDLVIVKHGHSHWCIPSGAIAGLGCGVYHPYTGFKSYRELSFGCGANVDVREKTTITAAMSYRKSMT